MKEMNEVLTAILKSLIGLALILSGIIFAVFQNTYIALPLGIIGFLVCLFSYLNLEIRKEKHDGSRNDDDSESF